LTGPDDRFRTFLTRRRVVLATVFLCVLLLASSTHVRLGFSSAAFLTEIFPDSPAYPGRWFSADPTRTLVHFRHEGEYHSALYYRPGKSGCGGGIVLYIGLGPEYGDAHLDRLARAFARNGYSVLIPVSQPMIEYRLGDQEHDIAVSAFRHLQAQPSVDPERVGLFGISVGGAVVLNAAQHDEIHDEVAMVHALGGFFDAGRVFGQMSARAYFVDGDWHAWEPSSTTFRATRNSLVPLLPSEDRVEVWNLFGEDVTTVPSGLTPEGQAMAEVLANRDPERIDELLDELPVDVREFLAALSPAHGVEHLSAPALLLHDRKDHVLPYSESVQFAELASEMNADVRLTLLDQFHHVRPDEDSDLLSLIGDGARLYRHIFAMHRAMDDRGAFTSPLDLLPFLGGQETC
jgi:acetyl esterase/lipase